MLVSANDIVGYLQMQASIFILSRTLGPGAVGLFNKGNSLALMPHTFITASVYSVLFREMAAQQDNLDCSQYLFLKSLTLVAIYATPFYVGLLWLAEPLVVSVYGPRWAESAGPLMILSLAWPLWLVDNLSGAVLSARNWLGRELPVQAAMLVVTALCIVVALPHGIDGVAWAIVAASAYRAGHLYWLACASLRLPLRACLPALMPAAALNTVLAAALAATNHALVALRWDLPWVVLGVMVGVGALVYGVCALAFPIPALDGERARWLSRLRLIGKG
jgi:O-antigen/teichoic acid export membrane protein